MKVKLAYGRNGLNVELPSDRTTVIEPVFLPGLSDERGALLGGLHNPIGSPPLRSLAAPDKTVAISVCDVTRPMPSSRVLPVLLEELNEIPREQIVIAIATGTHRSNSRDELEGMLGKSVVRDYRVVNHSAFDESALVELGETSSGIPIWMNRFWLESDLRITMGFVEPHFFAGFSGGPKMVAPGLAGIRTILGLHGAGLIGDPKSTWGITESNPIHDAIREIAGRVGVDFSLDVTLNGKHEITSVFAGELFRAHREACLFVRRTAMREVAAPFEVVLTTNSGYPLDQNLYQSVKGMSAASRVVSEGGTIICAAACSDGIPAHGEYGQILASVGALSEFLEQVHRPGYSRHDQWQVQIQALVQQHARVLLKSDGLSHSQIRSAHLVPVDDLEAAVLEALHDSGPNSRLCVLPQGPQTIPFLGCAQK